MLQRLVCIREPSGARRVAASAGARVDCWSVLLERFASAEGTEAPVFWQYPSERGVAIGRDEIDAEGREVSCQLLADDPADERALFRLRPLSADRLIEGLEEGVDTLPTLAVASAADPGALERGFRALDELFGARPDALQRFLHALREARVFARVGIEPVRATLRAFSLMELVLRCLPYEEAARLSYRTRCRRADDWPECGALFGDALSQPPTDARTAVFDLPGGEIDAPEPDERDVRLAEAMLAHDLNWVDRVNADARTPARPVDLALNLPPFERGMKLTRYVSDWAEALSERRAAVNDRALNEVVADWDKLENEIIRAGERTSNMVYLRELLEVIRMFESGELGDWLRVPARLPVELRGILVDSVRWTDVNLTREEDEALLMRVAEAAEAARGDRELAATPGFLGRADACVATGLLLKRDPESLREALRLLAEMDAPLARSFRSCMLWYADARCRREGASLEIDDLLLGALILGTAKRGEANPDAAVRFAAKLCGRDAARAVERAIAAKQAGLGAWLRRLMGK